MFRPSRLWLSKRGPRAWKVDGASAATRHFELTTLGKKKDIPMPAGGETGVSHSSDTSAKRSNNLMKRLFDAGAFRRLGGAGDWLQTIRFTEWKTVSVLFYPCIWGVGLGTTQAFVLEAADVVVLNLPLLPIHLIMQFLFAAWSARAAAHLWEEVLSRYIDKKPPTTKMTTKSLVSACVAHVSLCLLLTLNMHWSVTCFSVGIVAPAALYSIFWRRVRCDNKPTLLARQTWLGLISTSGCVMGYGSVVGRLDPVAVGGLWLAGTALTMMMDSVELMSRDDIASSLKEIPFWLSDVKVVLALYCPVIFGGFAASAAVTGQSVFFHIGAALVVLHLMAQVDHLNIADAWSCQNLSDRLPIFGRHFVVAIMIGNLFWWFFISLMPERPLGTEAREPQKEQVDSTLKKVLTMNTQPANRISMWSEVGWFERLTKPALAMAQLAAANDEPLLIPTYMRREFMGENFGRAMRTCFSAERLARWQGWWYAVSDHYNLFARF